MDMNEVIAEVKWTVQDVHDSFVNRFKREPTEDELGRIVNEVDLEMWKDNAIEDGWRPIDDLMKEKAPEIIKQIEEEKERKITQGPGARIFTFAPFGYEGSLVAVETDLRRGIPAVDIVGISDVSVKETREVVRAAVKNSGLEFPPERALQSFSPADLRKDGSSLTLSSALGFVYENARATGKSTDKFNEPVLVLGSLELDGTVRPSRGVHAAVISAKAAGITYVICDKYGADEISDIEGIKVSKVENLKEAYLSLQEPERFVENSVSQDVTQKTSVQFDEEQKKEDLPSMDGLYDTAHAIEVTVAGKHNLLLVGGPGCGKTTAIEHLVPYLKPLNTNDEAASVKRIKSIAGLTGGKFEKNKNIPPFRMPHQTASIEGMCGGGPNCNPGEISLAHNGTLFLDEAAEFRTSCLQMLRVPLESHQITLSRAGRTTSYPANFQLMAAANPCPCGNFGCSGKICLDSAKSIEQYWKKFSGPLIDRIGVRNFVEKNESDGRRFDPEASRERIRKAYEIQRERGTYNEDLTEEQLRDLVVLDDKGRDFFTRKVEADELTRRETLNLLRTSLTIANMDGRHNVMLQDLKEAYSMTKPLRDVIQQHNIEKEKEREPEIGRS